MARQLSPSSSSSSSKLSASAFEQYFPSPHVSRQFNFILNRTRTSKRVSRISSRIHPRKHFELNSSNGYPLNAVPLQNGSMSKPLVEEVPSLGPREAETTLSVTVVGASGDLAKKKIFPALFALFYEDFLPENFVIFGYARSKMNDEELRNMISRTLTCRIDQRENCADKMEQFLKRCYYHSGQYNSVEHFAELDSKLKEKEVMLFSCSSLSVFLLCKMLHADEET